MPIRQTLEGFRGQFNTLLDKIEDKIDPPKTTGPPPVPPRPGSSPAVPHGSRPYPSQTAPPPYSQYQQPLPYWNPQFSPEIPVSEHFDYELGASGWGNNELQNYTNLPSNAFHTPSRMLVLRAVIASHSVGDKYTSARLLSKHRLARPRGYVSAVLSAPCAPGIWPAFWLLPQEPFSWPKDGEVDIFEAWNGLPVNHSCLHWGNYTSPEDKSKHRVVGTQMPDLHQPHEYGFAWEQPQEWGQDGGRLVWYIDGRAVLKAAKPPGTRRLEEWRILLNIAVGGNVCDGRIPTDGAYDMVVSRLTMSDVPPGGWGQFENDWNFANGGNALN
jgi:hypothetical protein